MDQRKMNLKAKMGALPEDLNLVFRTELRGLTAPADLTLSRPLHAHIQMINFTCQRKKTEMTH